MRVLVVDDDRPILSFLKKGLEAEQYAVDVAENGSDAAMMAEQSDYDLLILDLNLPGLDGLEVLRRVRSRKKSLPILVLSSRRQIEERVKGLDLGADDYLPKPFAFSELSARIRVLLRRAKSPLDETARIEDLELNRLERRVTRAGKLVELTPKEFSLLEYLMRNTGRCVTRAMIIENVWNLSFDTMTNVVDVYINYLRKKVDDGFEPKLIHTIRGVGYQLGGLKNGEEKHES